MSVEVALLLNRRAGVVEPLHSRISSHRVLLALVPGVEKFAVPSSTFCLEHKSDAPSGADAVVEREHERIGVSVDVGDLVPQIMGLAQAVVGLG